MKSEAISKLAEDISGNEQHLMTVMERIRKVGVVPNAVAMNDKQLRLFADEIDRVGVAAGKLVDAMKQFVLHGSTKKLEQQQRTQNRYRSHMALHLHGIHVDVEAHTMVFSHLNTIDENTDE